MTDLHLTQTANPEGEALQRRTLRAIAIFEAMKGFAALAAGIGLLSLVHHDLRHIAEALIEHIGLDPGAHYPSVVLAQVDLLRNANLRTLLLLASGYALVRLVEAYGLWKQYVWGEWLSALSGALYVPFEVRHLLRHPTLASVLVLVANIAVLAFLAHQLRRRRRQLQAPRSTVPLS